jgi:hypothetical protein
VRALAERFAAHVGPGLARGAEREEDLAVRGAVADAVVAVVGAVDRVVGGDRQAVRALEKALAPGAEEGAVRGEDGDGVGGAGEDVDLVFGVHGDGGDFVEVPVGGELGPVGGQGVGVGGGA